MLTAAEIQFLNDQPTEAILAWAWNRFGPCAAIGTSFQGAGLVMMHLAQQHGQRFSVFTIDTGLLFPETVALRQRLEEFFGYRIETLVPDPALTPEPELWNHDPDLCCTLRKVYPLQRKLAEFDCWITGLRRQQSDARAAISVAELHESAGREIVKLNPMAHWTHAAVWDYIKHHRIPYNPLYDQGYRSIGCRPCTTTTPAGDNERAGRWTGFKKTECGLHTFTTKKT